jgi:hypothetical protein
VSSRIELILKLGNATGNTVIEKLGYSTVDKLGENTENRGRLNLRMDWATSFRDTVSMISEEPKMKNLLSAKHVFVGMATALFAGFFWVFFLINNNGELSLAADDFTIFKIPLIIILVMIGLTVGAIGKQRGETPLKVFFSVLLGTSLSPFAVMPLIFIAVMTLGKLVTEFGIIDPSTMPSKVASDLAMTAMLITWLVVGIIIGVTLLFVTIKISIKRPQQMESTS